MSEVEVSVLKNCLQQAVRQDSDEHWKSNQNLLGRVLTIIDAAIADPEQRKGIKDLIHTTWYTNEIPLGGKTQFQLMCEALGFELWDELEPTKSGPIPVHNPYSDLVK